MKATDILINKLSLLMEKAKLEQFQNNQSTYDFEFENENDTIGDIIQTYVFNNYVISNKKILDDYQCSYIGYIVKHPLDKILTIRITLDKENSEISFEKLKIKENLKNEIKKEILDVKKIISEEINKKESDEEDEELEIEWDDNF